MKVISSSSRSSIVAPGASDDRSPGTQRWTSTYPYRGELRTGRWCSWGSQLSRLSPTNPWLCSSSQNLPVSVIGYTISALLWISIGLVMRALVIEGLHPPLANADRAAPAFLHAYAHPLLAGVVFAGLFAAIMSTADGFLNIGAAAIVHDIPKAVRGRSLDKELFWSSNS